MDLFLPIFYSSGLDTISFILKVVVILIALLVLMAFALKNKTDTKIKIKNLNEHFKSYKKLIMPALLDKKGSKKFEKEISKETDYSKLPRSFLLHFNGDIKASEVSQLKECINALLTVAQKNDEVILDLESPGGMVHGYGLVASQLKRIKDAGIHLTICVDKVAASGGYMIACLADKIIAAPFSVIGSVGVVASVPNFNKLIKKNNVDYYQMTAGRYKRTMTLLGEITPEAQAKFQAELEETHVLFKNHIQHFRKKVDIELIATGEHWYGTRALELALVDELGTLDDYIFHQTHTRLVLDISYTPKKSFAQKMTDGLAYVLQSSKDELAEQSLKSSDHYYL